MKKIVTIVAAALIATAAFAEVNVGAWGRGFFVPGASNGKMGVSTGWGGAPRVGVSLSGSSENAGFAIDIKADGGNLAVNDNAYIWVKPFSFIKLSVGQMFDDTLRGNACFGLWDWERTGNTIGEDVVFTRVCENPLGGAYLPLQGAIVALTPVEGLYITAGFRTGYGEGEIAENVFKNLQVQAGYTVANIVQIKAQWIGYKAANGDAKGVINAAVGLKAVENLTLDVGAFFNTADKSDVDVAVFLGYSGVENLGLNAVAKLTIGTDSDVNKFAYNFGVGANYNFGNGIGVIGDVRFNGQNYKNIPDDAKKMGIGFLVAVEKGFSNGKIGVGVEGGSRTTINNVTQEKADDFQFAVPIKVEYWF